MRSIELNSACVFARFVKNENGATAIENAILAVVVVGMIAAGANKIGDGLNNGFKKLDQQIGIQAGEGEPLEAIEGGQTETNLSSDSWTIRN